MPFKNGRYVRNDYKPLAVTSQADTPATNSDKRILEKIQETKKEEALSEDQKKERLKKFVSFRVDKPPENS